MESAALSAFKEEIAVWAQVQRQGVQRVSEWLEQEPSLHCRDTLIGWVAIICELWCE